MDEHVNAGLKNFIPMSLHGAQLYKSGEHSWSDIGGLTDTKRSLMEILQWPLKYPEIFKNAPIKLQSGVLLYGMPGTGKTMLAKAIASECGVNLISIKVCNYGPFVININFDNARFFRLCRIFIC
jgi:peroxin-1